MKAVLNRHSRFALAWINIDWSNRGKRHRIDPAFGRRRAEEKRRRVTHVATLFLFLTAWLTYFLSSQCQKSNSMGSVVITVWTRWDAPLNLGRILLRKVRTGPVRDSEYRLTKSIFAQQQQFRAIFRFERVLTGSGRRQTVYCAHRCR